jgi:hypothetical protein
MRKTVRLFSAVGPTERLGQAIAGLPPDVRHTLAQVAVRTDLPLIEGSWQDDSGGCLVANAVACAGVATAGERTLDLRMLDAFPQMSSRDLSTLIVAWDQAAPQAGAVTDADLRELLRAALRWADVPVSQTASPGPPPHDVGVERSSAARRQPPALVGSSPSVTVASRSSPSRM